MGVDELGGAICWPNGADLSPRMLYAEAKPAVPACADAATHGAPEQGARDTRYQRRMC